MKLWMSAEYSGNISDELRVSQNFVEDEINSIIDGKDYDIDLKSWDCIAVLMKDKKDQERYCEIIKYSPKTKDMDFRLQIDYPEFVNGDVKRQQQLIYEMLMRSLDLLIEKGLNEAGIENLRQDTQSVALKNGWITIH
ncbi:Imm44 family immunity protein [Psychrobacter sp. I-STPA6b]|uniref:Imm44 family immunity protein n=1 Tax=Psychrobacter sp. I-STPA6b TaxID=2585718 RepID=UPI001D0CD8CC|nr:Imm44 family immunity protein [Psychrobacter sp. I-STPA6b]